MNFDSTKLSKWAKRVKARDGHRCKQCGSRRKLHAHHKKQKSIHPHLAYNLSNGITLCERCHHAWHKKNGYGKKKRRWKTATTKNRKRTGRITVRPKKYKKKKYKVKVRR